MIYRLPDQMSRYKNTSRNVSDFIAYSRPYVYLLEVKSIEKNTFSCKFRQYEELVKYAHYDGVIPCVLVWFVDHDKAVLIPIKTFTRLIEDGKKSFHVNMIGDERYRSWVIDSTKLRTYLKLNFTSITNVADDINDYLQID